MQTTEEMIAVMQAYVDGKQIEMRDAEDENDCWEPAQEPGWDWLRYEYRVAT